MTDAQTRLDRYNRLLSELREHTLDDAEATVCVFRYSDDLIDFMNEAELGDPTEARDYLHELVEDVLDDLDDLQSPKR